MPGTVESAGVLALRSPESGRETGEKTILGDRIVLQSNAFFSGEEKTTQVIYSFFFFFLRVFSSYVLECSWTVR